MLRSVEEKIAEERKSGAIGGPVHLGIGQEAIPVGLSENIDSTDYVFGAHRSHYHILALDSSIKRLFAEVLGKQAGLSKGMGGSMHLIDTENGFYGSTPIVAGTVSLAVGAALTAKKAKEKQIAVAYLGDGACEEGVVHESFNFASAYDLPILFVCENNFFSSHMHITQRQPEYSISRFASANSIRSIQLDGNNVLDIYGQATDLIAYIRRESKPAFIEAFTYRWRGHVDWRDDTDVGVCRSSEDLSSWKKFDPISTLKSKLYACDPAIESTINEYSMYLQELIGDCWEFAVNSDYPSTEQLLGTVYFK